MKVTVQIPDDIAQQLDQTEGNLSRRLLELIVADAYSCGKINTAEVRQILPDLTLSHLEMSTFN